MDPRSFLVLARRLAGDATAAECRTGINRAYYAAFNVGVSTLSAAGVAVAADASGHGQLRGYLQNSQDAALQRVADRLNQLYRDREAADYRLNDPGPDRRATAERAVSLAEQCVEALDQFAIAPVERQQQAVRFMQNWIRSPRRTHRSG
jgi:hypothetical protein